MAITVVGGWTPEKWWSSSVGIFIPNIWKIIQHVPNHRPDLLVLDPSVYLLPINQLTYGPPQGSVPNHTFFRPICVVHVHGQHLVIPQRAWNWKKNDVNPILWTLGNLCPGLSKYKYICIHIYIDIQYIYIHWHMFPVVLSNYRRHV